MGRYSVNDAHAPGRGLRAGAGKTKLPADAEEVYRHAVPNDPDDPGAWFGSNSEGEIYRYSYTDDKTVHFSGTVDNEMRNYTTYAQRRLAALTVKK